MKTLVVYLLLAYLIGWGLFCGSTLAYCLIQHAGTTSLRLLLAGGVSTCVVSVCNLRQVVIEMRQFQK